MNRQVSGLDILELDGYADGADARGMLNGAHICCMCLFMCECRYLFMFMYVNTIIYIYTDMRMVRMHGGC
jgi:hypothetical protein